MNETLLKASKKRILFSNLLESIFLFFSSLILVFAVGMPIVNNISTYQNALTNNVTYKDNMLEIGTSSKLFFYNEEFNNISTLLPAVLRMLSTVRATSSPSLRKGIIIVRSFFIYLLLF